MFVNLKIFAIALYLLNIIGNYEFNVLLFTIFYVLPCKYYIINNEYNHNFNLSSLTILTELAISQGVIHLLLFAFIIAGYTEVAELKLLNPTKI